MSTHEILIKHQFNKTVTWSRITYIIEPNQGAALLIHILEPFKAGTVAKNEKDIETAILEAYTCYLKAQE